MKGYVFSICLMMVGTIALAYNNLEYSGYPRNTSCTGECYEEYVSIYGTPSEIERAKQELASADEFRQGMAVFPKLAGRSSDYIVDRLTTYKNRGTVGAMSSTMWAQAAMLSEEEIDTIGRFIGETLND